MKPLRSAWVLCVCGLAGLLSCSSDGSTTLPEQQGGSAGTAGVAAGGSGVGGAGQAGTAGNSAGAGGLGVGGSQAGGGGQAAGAGGDDGGTAGAGGGAAGADSGVVTGPEGPSCTGGLICFVGNVSCCQNTLIPGGTFLLGRGTEECGKVGCQTSAGNEGCPNNCLCYAAEQPEHNATVADFYLDTFEVTVGRFRKFLEAYTGVHPVEGAGAHPAIPGSGWQSTAWNQYLPTTAAALISNIKCEVKLQTWTDTPANQEHYPINCVNWYEAFAFCLWDGGFLPTEAEWEYAAAGGDQNRQYPWGTDDPSEKAGLANDYYSDKSPLINVGAHSSGRARWGQLDVAGSLWEWSLDTYDDSWYKNAGANCTNCANLTAAPERTLRGGDYYQFAEGLRSAYRVGRNPLVRGSNVGFRCARSP